MTLPPKAIGPYRYHLLDREPFQETRMSLLWLANTLDAQRRQTDKVVVKVARLKEERFSLANQRAIDNEEQWLRKLHHPGIIKLRPIAEDGTVRPGQEIYRARSTLPGNPWFVVTDYLPGGTLHSLVEERQKLHPALALQIALHLAQALAYIHEQGCVHRDFKPRNILFTEKPGVQHLSPRSQPILIDFGIANRQGEQQIIAGTVPWLAPECERALREGAKLPAIPAIDIYALGLVLYYMLTGQHPPAPTPNRQIQLQIQTSDLRSIPARQRATVAAALNRLVNQSTADTPQRRLSAQQFAAEIERLLPRITVARFTLFPAAWALPRRWPWIAGLGVAALLVWLLSTQLAFIPDSTGATPPTAAAPTGAGNPAVITATLPLTATTVVTPTVVLPTATNSPVPTATTAPPTATETPTALPTVSPTQVAPVPPPAQPTSTLAPTLTPTPRPTFTPTPQPTAKA